MNTAQQLHAAGQSIWYDNIQRSLLDSGALAGMIARGEIRGVTSNPTIFMNAITKSSDYDAELAPLTDAGHNAEAIFWQLAIADIQRAADLFLPLYTATRGDDGYVSLEVSPYLAHDAAATLIEARRLWQRVNRPNLMVKIPATLAGLPAITAAIAEGINVNVTLIFSNARYRQVLDAYQQGLEARVAQGLPLATVASVASFFVSRVDTKVDAQLAAHAHRAAADGLLGSAAIANARLAYADFKAVSAAPRWQALAAHGARVQRPLWASTGVKNPAYRDVLYVEELVGPDTVNTVPPQTLAAFLAHGAVRPQSLEEDIAGAQQVLASLAALGITLDDVTAELEQEGVAAFADAFTQLLHAVEARRQRAGVVVR